MSGTDVFISYAHEDISRARALANAFLAARGWSVWWDTSLKTGEQYPRRIQEAVAASRCVVVVWSRHSIVSDWVIAEASEGWDRKILIPVRLDDSEPPLPFRQTQARDLSGWRSGHREPALLALIEDIQRVHAQGAEVSAAELTEREQRRRAFQRRQMLRRGAYAALALLLIGGGWLLWRGYETRAKLTGAAEQLARDSDEVRGDVLKLTAEEDRRIWWVHLFEDDERADKLELSVLLGVEAVRHRNTEHAERALRDSLALLPWSDQQVEIDDSDVPLALDFNGTGQLLAAGGGARGTLVWDLERNAIITRIAHGGTGGLERWTDKRGTFIDCRGSRRVMDFNPIRDVVATAGPDATARIWDARSGRELSTLQHGDIVTAVTFDARGRWLASSDESGVVCLWDAPSSQRLHCMQHNSPVYWVGFSPSAALLASVGADGVINIWRPEAGRLERRLVHEAGVEAARFDAHETLIATFGSEVETRLWNLANSAEPWVLPIFSDGDAGVAFDPTGETLIVGSADGTLSWWNLKSRELRFSIPIGSDYMGVMATTADGRYAATLDVGQEARAWDLSNGRLIKRMPYARELMGLAVTPDGKRFATMADEQIGRRVLEVTQFWPGDAVATACAQLGRNLTRNEWHQYLGSEPYRLTCPAIRADQSR